MRASTHLLAEATSAGAARRFVSTTLVSWGVAKTTDMVTLLVSELVTNSLLHARSVMDVAVEMNDETVRVTVEDRSPAMPVLLELDDSTLTGRGLTLVDAYADRWGVEPHAAGKAVWFEIPA